MKRNELYSIRLAKAVNGQEIFYIADMNLSFVVNKLYEYCPDAQIVKVIYEGEVYV